MPKLIETRTICKQPRRYIGWPTVARGADGVLHACFSGDREGHVCPFGKSYYIRSTDDGQTWSDPVVINDTPVDDRDTGLCVCPDGTLVMTWFTSHYYGTYPLGHAEGTKGGKDLQSWAEWERVIRGVSPADADHWVPLWSHPSPETVEQYTAAMQERGVKPLPDCDDSRYPPATRRLGYWCRRSRDGGKTWDEPTACPVSAPHGANVLSNGDLIYAGTMRDESAGVPVVAVARSSDQGITWKVIHSVAAHVAGDGPTTEKGGRLCEPHIVEVSPGRLLVMARYQATDHDKRILWQMSSDDGGKTWTPPASSNVLGYPPHLLKLNDGRILVSYAVRRTNPGQRFCVSNDGGKTWDPSNEFRLPEGPSGDLGYPSSAQLNDGSIISVYYQRETISEKPCLIMSHWSL